MNIRRAEPKDSRKILELSRLLKVNWTRPQQSGFLVNQPTEEQYRERTQSPLFYVAEQNNILAGFLMCFDSKTFRRLAETGKISSLEGDIKFMLKQKDPWVFGDQIGINPLLNRRKVGTDMMKALFRDMREKTISDMYVSILHEPVRNYASIRFCEGMGFEEIHGSEAHNSNRTTWGMYHLKLR